VSALVTDESPIREVVAAWKMDDPWEVPMQRVDEQVY
jgi:hypothetical protein